MYSGLVYDAINILCEHPRKYVLDKDIRPLDDSKWMFGKVFTTKGELVEEERYDEFDKIRLEIPDAITDEKIVLLEAGDSLVAHAGDITFLVYRDSGIMGFLTDGYIRDSRIVKHEMEFPCFCKGTLPIDAIGLWALTEYKQPIYLRNVDGNFLKIYTGDHIYADSDGAIIIPQGFADEVFKVMYDLAYREEEIRNQLKNLISAKEVYEAFGRW